jgi:hypothetical protein
MGAELIGELQGVIDALGETDLHALSDDDLMRQTESLLAAGHRLDAAIAQRLQVMNVRDSTVAETGLQTRSWLVEHQCLSPAAAGARMFVAKTLPERPTLAAALGRGELSHDHAKVIISLLRATPIELRDLVEKELVEASLVADPTSLGRLARELKDRFGANETREAAEARKYDNRWVNLTDTYDGMVSLSGMLDPAGAETLRAAIRPMLGKADPDDPRSIAQRRADAMVSLATQALNAGQLPDVAGDRPHLVVTMPYQQLLAELTAAEDTARATWVNTLNGIEISPTTARMLACDAGIIPAVLGSHGEILDLGRKTPAWSTAQRRALLLQTHGRCGWPAGCRRNADHIHHMKFWSRGGTTDTRNGIPLCTFHHHVVHHTNWRIGRGPDGAIRTWRE